MKLFNGQRVKSNDCLYELAEINRGRWERELLMLVMIGGYPRSGTTLLQSLCDLHPEMAVTNEFGCFRFIGQSYGEYVRSIFDRWKRVRGKWAFDVSYTDYRKIPSHHKLGFLPFAFALPLVASSKKLENLAHIYLNLTNFRFALLHLIRFRQQYQGQVTAVSLEATYHRMFPGVKIVGDKWPHYLFRMNKFVQEDDLTRLVIYRDGRDVISSCLIKARTDWKDTTWIQNVDNAEKIAKKWVRGIEIMETHADKLVIVQYEALMHEPEKELQRVSEAIGVDPAGFPVDLINPGSIGKYQKNLMPEDLETVMEVAGPTMERLGYLS